MSSGDSNNSDVWRENYNRRIKRLESKPFDPELNCKPLSYDLKRGGMDPIMFETIGLTSPGHWSIGSLMTCERVEVGHSVPLDAVCQWVDDGFAYCIRKRPEPRTDRTVEGDPLPGRLFRNFSHGVWTLTPNIFCKVQGWVEGMTTDATTLRFVNQHVPSLPTEELLYDWIDPEWNRSFMLTRRVAGTRYDEAWELLTKEQRLQIADQVAGHLKALAELTSDCIETVTGTGLVGQYSLRLREDLPHWKPRVEPKVTREDYRAFLKRKWKVEPPEFGEHFVLMHRDVSPTNFFVTTPSNPDENAKVTAIIDWECVGYFPKFLVSTMPRVQPHFAIETKQGVKDFYDWMWMLPNALFRAGFPLEMDWLKQGMQGSLQGYALEEIICFENLPS